MSTDDGIWSLMYGWSLLELRLIKDDPEGSKLPYRDVMYLNVIDSLGKTTVSELARISGVTKSTVTTRISRLERNGMVTKVRSEEDARIKFITLSDHAKELYGREREAVDEAIVKTIEKFGVKRMDEMSEVLSEISRNLRSKDSNDHHCRHSREGSGADRRRHAE